MRWEQKVEFALLSDIGFRRQNNQDSCTVLMAHDRQSWDERGHLFMVADGMGGHAVGELASKIAVDTVPLAFNKLRHKPISESLQQSIADANTAIHNRGMQNRDFLNMGTTCSTLILSPEGACVGHVGDSRVYRIRGNQIDQLTFDHSRQWELLREGKMKPEDVMLYEPRNVITRCLGPDPNVQVDIEGPFPVLPGDIYLLCSDGLTNLLNDAEIGIIARELPPAEACRLLVNLANLRGGSDNITVVIARVGELPKELDELPPPEPVQRVHAGAWGWLIATWVLAAMAVGAFAVMVLVDAVVGILGFALLNLAAGGTLLAWLRVRRLNRRYDPDRTILWRPYRTAELNLQPAFLSQIASLEHVLEQLAIEETWKIDWERHKTAYTAARNALTREDLRSALRFYAETLHVLMSGIQQQRRKLDRAAKWNRPLPERERPGVEEV
ncbi:MAG TPA: PP2C family serine/threonine-protein phosphatase [Planctomycetaceae bacterium]|nr:PP2C family serine/threonine-protein phosphatase [Planctomycetaceae bacterium]